MATDKNITMRQFNGTDYDTLYPKTLGTQIASTVPVSAGGTGINVNPNIHVNLGAENTANVFESYPRPGIYGTLPVSHGGTGQTSLEALASAMGATKIQTGSYVGTGTYGASNPNSLTFSIPLKIFMLNGLTPKSSVIVNDYVNEMPYWLYFPSYGNIIRDSSQAAILNIVTMSNNAISWYTNQTNAGVAIFAQYNASGRIYYYCGIG